MDINKTCAIISCVISHAVLCAYPVHEVRIIDEHSSPVTSCDMHTHHKAEHIGSYPTFGRESACPLQIEMSVWLALAYARYHLADGIDLSQSQLGPCVQECAKAPPIPFAVCGVEMKNLMLRATPFFVQPILSTNALHCVAVSFFSKETEKDEQYLCTIYVCDSTGEAGLSVQECSDYKDFLKDACRFPFLSHDEYKSQQSFYDGIMRRRWREVRQEFAPVMFVLPMSPGDRSRMPDVDVELELD